MTKAALRDRSALRRWVHKQPLFLCCRRPDPRRQQLAGWKTVDLGNLAALYNVKPGDELIFGIFVLNTGDSFLMGPGARNGNGLLTPSSTTPRAPRAISPPLGSRISSGAETATTMTPISSSREASEPPLRSPSRLP